MSTGGARGPLRSPSAGIRTRQRALQHTATSRGSNDASRDADGRRYPELRRHAAPGHPQPYRPKLPTERCKGLSVAPARVLATTRRKTSKYRVRSTCLCYNRRISGPAVVMTTVREDDHQPRAYLVHEGCQSAMLLEIPFDDAPEPETERG